MLPSGIQPFREPFVLPFPSSDFYCARTWLSYQRQAPATARTKRIKPMIVFLIHIFLPQGLARLSSRHPIIASAWIVDRTNGHDTILCCDLACADDARKRCGPRKSNPAGLQGFSECDNSNGEFKRGALHGDR